MSRNGILLALLYGLSAAPIALAEPPCAEQCKKFVEEGELRDDVSPVGCFVRVCQREARKFYEKHEFKKALESLDYVQEHLDRSPSYQMERGLNYYALGRFDKALAAYEKVLKGFPNNVRTRSQRGHTLVRLGRLKDAQKQFESLFADPLTEDEFKGLRTRSYLMSNIGVIKLLQGDVEGGKAALEQGLELDGRNRPARSYLTDVVPYMESGDLTPKGAMRLLVAYEELSFGRHDSGAKELRELLERSPRFRPGYFRVAEVLMATQQYEECVETLEDGEKALPDDIDLRAERLRCSLLQLGPNTDKARPSLEEVKSLAKAHPENERLQQILTAMEQ